MDRTEPTPINPLVKIGHIHLKVSDLERSLKFYKEAFGFELTQKYGEEAAFISAGGYHHHIGLNTWESKGGQWPPAGCTGLFHLALLYPDRKSLAVALRRIVSLGIKIEGASDHGVSEAIYFSDPDGNGIEIYWDRAEYEWPRNSNGTINMFTKRLDLNELLEEA